MGREQWLRCRCRGRGTDGEHERWEGGQGQLAAVCLRHTCGRCSGSICTWVRKKGTGGGARLACEHHTHLNKHECGCMVPARGSWASLASIAFSSVVDTGVMLSNRACMQSPSIPDSGAQRPAVAKWCMQAGEAACMLHTTCCPGELPARRMQGLILLESWLTKPTSD